MTVLARKLQDDPNMASAASAVIEDLQGIVRSSIPDMSETAWEMIAVALRDEEEIEPMRKWLDQRLSDLILDNEGITGAEDMPEDILPAIIEIFEMTPFEQLCAVNLLRRYLKDIGSGPICSSVRGKVLAIAAKKSTEPFVLSFFGLEQSV